MTVSGAKKAKHIVVKTNCMATIVQIIFLNDFIIITYSSMLVAKKVILILSFSHSTLSLVSKIGF